MYINKRTCKTDIINPWYPRQCLLGNDDLDNWWPRVGGINFHVEIPTTLRIWSIYSEEEEYKVDLLNLDDCIRVRVGNK